MDQEPLRIHFVDRPSSMKLSNKNIFVRVPMPLGRKQMGSSSLTKWRWCHVCCGTPEARRWLGWLWHLKTCHPYKTSIHRLVRNKSHSKLPICCSFCGVIWHQSLTWWARTTPLQKPWKVNSFLPVCMKQWGYVSCMDCKLLPLFVMVPVLI